jgi:hypothetical protein
VPLAATAVREAGPGRLDQGDKGPGLGSSTIVQNWERFGTGPRHWSPFPARTPVVLTAGSEPAPLRTSRGRP